MHYLTFITMLILFLLVGLLHILFKSQDTVSAKNQSEDFHLAKRSLPGWIGGMTAAASSHSAFMFTGMVGAIIYSFTFTWLLVGWIIGAIIAWYGLYQKFWQKAKNYEVVTLAQFISTSSYGKGRNIFLKSVAVLLVFLMGFYASAQILAADSTLGVVFGETSWIYVIGCFAVILIYSSLGGLRSTVNSDVLQGGVIIISLIAVISVMLSKFFAEPSCQEHVVQLMKGDYFNLTWGSGISATLLFITGWIIGGFSEVGAPHVAVRVFSIQSKKQVHKGANTYIFWFVLLSVLVILFAVLAKIMTPCLNNLTEATSGAMVYGTVINELLPPWLIGIALAGFVAATISTADSLILAASASVSEDLSKNILQKNTLTSRQATVAVVGIVTFGFYYILNSIATAKGVDIYGQITLAWALIASVFVAPAVLSIIGRTYPIMVVYASSLCGALMTIFWVVSGYNNTICYELLPGIATAFLILYPFSKVKEKKL